MLKPITVKYKCCLTITALLGVAFLFFGNTSVAISVSAKSAPDQIRADSISVRAELERLTSELTRFEELTIDEMARLSERPVKGEFETTKQFEARQTVYFETLTKRENSIRQRRQKHFVEQMKLVGNLMQQEFVVPATFELGNYDADRQVFPLVGKDGEDEAELSVPLAEAPRVKSQFANAVASKRFSLYSDFSETVRELTLGAKIELEGKTYQTLTANMTVDRAMSLLYSEYDQSTGRALVEFNKAEAEYGNWVEGEPIFAKPFFSKTYSEGLKEKFIILTSAAPPGYDCHACSPVIGASIFVKESTGWKLDLAHKSIGHYFSWGQAAKPRFERIGKDKYGVILEWEDGGQGWFSGQAHLLAATDHVLEEVGTFLTSENNAGGVSNREDYVAITGRYDFIPGQLNDFYNIRIVYRGKKATGKGNRVVIKPFSKVVLYEFKNGQYVANDPYISPAEKYI